MNFEAQIVENRDGANPEFTVQKMPGLKKYGTITLKRGVMQGDNYHDWVNAIKLNATEPLEFEFAFRSRCSRCSKAERTHG